MPETLFRHAVSSDREAWPLGYLFLVVENAIKDQKLDPTKISIRFKGRKEDELGAAYGYGIEIVSRET